MKLEVLVSLLFLVTFVTSDDPSLYTCHVGVRAPGVTQAPNPPPMPSLNGVNAFTTKIEAAIIETNTTVSAEEYYDYNNNRAALFMLLSGDVFKLIYDYNTNELFYVNPDLSCETHNLQNDTNNVFFGNIKLSNHLHVFNTLDALQFATNQGQTYMGQTTVRGILCDYWRTCLNWPMVNSTFTLDFYFTNPKWNTPSGISQVPVRAEIFGFRTKGNGQQHKFHHVYDYTEFRVGLPDDTTVFETPSMVVCTNRKQVRPPPQITQAFIYREEIVPKSGISTTADVWYDKSLRLVRYDFRPHNNAAPYYNTDAATEVHDFNTGVAYAIDRIMANCTIIPIMNASFDASINVSVASNQQQFVLKMKSPQDLFYIDNNYTYAGQRYARGQQCDVFIRKRSDFMMSGVAINATLEFYFLSKNQIQLNNDGMVVSQASDIPIQLNVNIPSIHYSVTYSIYNYDPEEPAINSYDVSTCYSVDKKMGFKVTFYGTFDATVRTYKDIFLYQSISVAANAAGVTPLRIAKPSFHMESGNAYFIATLLDRAPVLQRYRKIPGHVVQYNNDAVIQNIRTPDTCADLCNSNPNFTCNSFEYCSTSKVCTLSKIHTSDGHMVSSTQQCDLYDRTLGSNAYVEVPLLDAWQNLRNSVIKKLFQVSIKYDKNSQVYTAQDIVNDVVDSQDLPPSATASLQSFKSMPNRYVPNFDDTVFTHQSIDDCAQACVDQTSFVCQSFEYQLITGTCILSHLHPDEHPGAIKNIQGTDLYIRDYTSKFTKLPGQTVLSSSNVIYQQVFDTNQCAKLCDNYMGFNCKSFDFCFDIGTCFLGKTHVLDVPKADVISNPMCNHYSRNYTEDFQKTARHTIQLVNDRIVTGVTLAQCAKNCVDMEAGSCASFSYCDLKSICRLSTASLKNVGQVSATPSATCDMYTRQYFPDGTGYVSNPQQYFSTKSSSSSNVSSSSAVGIAVTMLILGVIFTVVGIFVYLRKTNKRLQDIRLRASD
ncbi:uncharacterized protein LOC130054319 [Ostrea edulis]|uniref:uncharacterized protein LOC130054319 n=1 Tax=Ostrea edulis TaxID=37623 RepID=UPI0024AEA9CA|nr:uncharacterized protein LOC130054319 [Ostrea edulis]